MKKKMIGRRGSDVEADIEFLTRLVTGDGDAMFPLCALLSEIFLVVFS